MSKILTLKEQMKALAHEMMRDVSDAYKEGDSVKAYNALTRMRVGSESLEKLASTAVILEGGQ